MASKINADEFVDREGEGKPTLPKGVVLSGVTTITTAVVAENEVANSTGINAGIITSTHFKGNLTGDVNAGIVTVTSQSVIGSAVTISASGIDIGAGVITATSYAGSGANLTGIGATIMIWEYNPDPGDSLVTVDTGIGITFNQKIKAGSGNITLRKDSSSGDLVENFGIGSSVTIAGNELSFTPTSNLDSGQTYYISLPSGVITNMASESYVGTAYTFKTPINVPMTWGAGDAGQLAQNNETQYSSPVQIPGTGWTGIEGGSTKFGVKTDGTLWAWGYNAGGQLGLNTNDNNYSSPTQIPGTTWAWARGAKDSYGIAVKTDGTLWTWGNNGYGNLGHGDKVNRSSPVQVPGTTWTHSVDMGTRGSGAVKTDGTMWVWGNNAYGNLGNGGNWESSTESPIQLPGTTWSKYYFAASASFGLKTDGTLWGWGRQTEGSLGQNNTTQYASPVQIPGTTWTKFGGGSEVSLGLKSDGTLWAWGRNNYGQLAQNDVIYRSSPVQVPGTTWTNIVVAANMAGGIKSDNTLWVWGRNANGALGLNQSETSAYSSPVQMPGVWTQVESEIYRGDGSSPVVFTTR